MALGFRIKGNIFNKKPFFSSGVDVLGAIIIGFFAVPSIPLHQADSALYSYTIVNRRSFCVASEINDR